MKTIALKKVTILLFFILIGSGIQTAQAQFWKKIKKRVKDGVEEAILRKTEEKTVEKTENSIDSIFEAPKKIRKKRREKKNKKRKNGSNSSTNQVEDHIDGESDEFGIPQDNDDIDLPDSYNFEWKYVLRMESSQTKKHQEVGDMNITYYLSPNTTTFASKFEMGGKNPSGVGNMLMIMDLDTGANLMLMEMDGQKLIQRMPSVSTQDVNDTMDEQSSKDYTIVKTDTKTILGYSCQGFKIKSSDGIIHMYVAKDAPVSFNNAMAGNSKFKPKGFNPKWLKEFKNGLMLEMDFVSSKKKKHNIKVTCVELVKEPLSINLSAYKSFMTMGDK